MVVEVFQAADGLLAWLRFGSEGLENDEGLNCCGLVTSRADPTEAEREKLCFLQMQIGFCIQRQNSVVTDLEKIVSVSRADAVVDDLARLFLIILCFSIV